MIILYASFHMYAFELRQTITKYANEWPKEKLFTTILERGNNSVLDKSLKEMDERGTDIASRLRSNLESIKDILTENLRRFEILGGAKY